MMDEKIVPIRSMEEMVDARRRQMKLAECTLPEGIRLVTAQPKQTVMEGLLVWAFVLGFKAEGLAYLGDVRAEDAGAAGGMELYHTQRYWPGVAEDVQMRWALREFAAELEQVGVNLSGEVGRFAEEMPSRQLPRNPPRLNGGRGGMRKRMPIGSTWMRGGFHSTGRRAVPVPA